MIEAFVHLLGIMARPRTSHGERKKVWRRFGVWLLLGLEFELAADIIGSIVSPTWEDIGQLGAIAVIRTFLNYFLEQDLDQPTRQARRGSQPNHEDLSNRHGVSRVPTASNTASVSA